MQGHLRSVAVLWSAAALVSCSEGPAASLAPTPASTGPSVSTSATATVPSAPAQSAPDDFALIPLNAAAEARRALADLRAAPAADSPAHLALRRAVARGELFFRERGFMAEALFGAGLIDETGGALGRLEMALVEGDRQA